MTGASPLVSSSGDAPLTVWIEPWCDEFVLPPRASLGCVMLDAPADASLPEVEVNADGLLVIWASAPGRTLFTIDGIAQDTGSRDIALPSELFAMPVKRFVGITFGNAPEARPGALVSKRPSRARWWRKLLELIRH